MNVIYSYTGSDSAQQPPSVNTAPSLPSTAEAEKPRKQSDHRKRHPFYEAAKSSSSDEHHGREVRRKGRGKRKKSTSEDKHNL